MIKILDFNVPVDGVIFLKEDFIQMDNRKLATLMGCRNDVVEPSEVVGMAKLQVKDDGVYGEVEFFPKAIKPPEGMLLSTSLKTRNINNKPYMVYLNIILPEPGKGKIQFHDGKLLEIK